MMTPRGREPVSCIPERRWSERSNRSCHMPELVRDWGVNERGKVSNSILMLAILVFYVLPENLL